MNQVIDNIKQRRSVRSYDGRKIDKRVIETVIDAGCWAPSAANSQPWRFVVVEDNGFKNKLLGLAIPRYKKWLESMSESIKEMRKEVDSKQRDTVYYGAPVIIFVIGKGMAAELDCPMACQNIMLAARSLGLGSCWVYIGQLPLDDKSIRESLEIQEGEKVFGPILLGYPKDGFPKAPEKKPSQIKWI